MTLTTSTNQILSAISHIMKSEFADCLSHRATPSADLIRAVDGPSCDPLVMDDEQAPLIFWRKNLPFDLFIIAVFSCNKCMDIDRDAMQATADFVRQYNSFDMLGKASIKSAFDSRLNIGEGN